MSRSRRGPGELPGVQVPTSRLGAEVTRPHEQIDGPRAFVPTARPQEHGGEVVASSGVAETTGASETCARFDRVGRHTDSLGEKKTEVAARGAAATVTGFLVQGGRALGVPSLGLHAEVVAGRRHATRARAFEERCRAFVRPEDPERKASRSQAAFARGLVTGDRAGPVGSDAVASLQSSSKLGTAGRVSTLAAPLEEAGSALRITGGEQPEGGAPRAWLGVAALAVKRCGLDQIARATRATFVREAGVGAPARVSAFARPEIELQRRSRRHGDTITHVVGDPQRATRHRDAAIAGPATQGDRSPAVFGPGIQTPTGRGLTTIAGACPDPGARRLVASLAQARVISRAGPIRLDRPLAAGCEQYEETSRLAIQ